MEFWEIIGIWIAAFLTICIFSFLYKDNPIYKFAEHLYVGVSAGYVMTIYTRNALVPNLFGNLSTAWKALITDGKVLLAEWSFLIAAILGIMLILRLVPRVSWISRWPLAFMVGLGAGLNVPITMNAAILAQINPTIKSLWLPQDPGQMIFNILLIGGVCTGLIYFYFSIEHKGPIIGGASRIGIAVLMISFGAAFGYTVMARISLLVGRFLFFRDYWWPTIPYILKSLGPSG
ncbi:MAG: hypothetical protein J7M18_02695 [Candidatus Eremiobacteraeota bacterium]|nr:hypothetical protein [Candidatus Eremiobacteraeota bacterium]